jgi:flagellar protein FliO/FliZ
MATLALFGRMLLALALVLGLVFTFSRLARRVQRRERVFNAAPGARIEVLAKKSLSRANSLLVVRAGGRELLIGATAQSLSLIADLSATADSDVDQDSAPEGEDANASMSFVPRAKPRTENGPPWTAGIGENRPPSAWDALVSQLRERTVRR